MNKVIKKTYRIFFTNLHKDSKDNSELNYRIYYATEYNFDFKPYEDRRNNLDISNPEYYFNSKNKELPLYVEIEDYVVTTSLLITPNKNFSYTINDLCNDIPITITKMATDLQKKAIIEVEIEEEIANKYDFDLRNLILQIDLLDFDDSIKNKLWSVAC